MLSLPYFDSKQSELLLREVLETSPSAIVGETKEGRVALVNARFLELTGWQGRYEGQTIDALVSDWASRVLYPQAVESYFQSCRSGNLGSGTIELQPNPGQVIQAQCRQMTSNEGTKYRVWFFQEWKTSALAWVSHEIKNPLNAVLGFSELLSEALATTPQSQAVTESLRGLRIGAKHLQSVIGDLLDLSRLESGVVEPKPEWTSVGRFLEDLGDLFRTRFRRRGLEFQVQGPQDSPVEVWLDPGRLSQILSNFLSNALRFTKRGWVSLTVTRSGPAWEFSVEDSGVGIPIDQQKTIFEPFVQKQGQDAHKFGGSGLGLAICRTLAQSMGAHLSLESQPGTGSRFSVTFDGLDHRPEVGLGPTPPPEVSAETQILVADDERSNHWLVHGYLRGTNVTLLSAFDGAQAVELWKTHRPRIVLMDLRMPRLSGVEAAREIRALDPEGKTCLLAMSATKLSGLESGEGRERWSGFLEKPFGKREFLKFLANHLSFVDEPSPKP